MRFIAIFLLSSVSLQAQAQLAVPQQQQQGSDLMGKAMVVSKIAGLCEGLRQVQVFQQAAQLDGGDAFVAGFLAAEAKRLGKTMEDLDTQCNTAQRTYEQLANMAGIEPI